MTTNDFVLPLFLLEGSKKKSEVDSMPGIFRLSEDVMLKEIEECMKLGIKGFDVFPVLTSPTRIKWRPEATIQISSI